MTAADTDGTIAKVRLTLPGGTNVDLTTAPYTYSWNSATVANGAAKLSAVATDNLGATSATATINVTVTNGTSCVDGTFQAADVPIAIPDNVAAGITSHLAIAGSGNVSTLTLSLNITHTYRGDLKVTLRSPAGTDFVVANQTGGSADNIIITNQAITTFNGQPVTGSWSLIVADLAAADVGTLNSWSLTVKGDCSGGGGGGTSWSASATPNMATVDNGQACTSVTVTGTGNAADVLLDVNGTHSWRSILRATLAHNGVTNAAFPVSTFPASSGTFSFTNRAVAGFTGDATGVWTLCIIDTDAYNDTGSLASWAVHK